MTWAPGKPTREISAPFLMVQKLFMASGVLTMFQNMFQTMSHNASQTMFRTASQHRGERCVEG